MMLKDSQKAKHFFEKYQTVSKPKTRVNAIGTMCRSAWMRFLRKWTRTNNPHRFGRMTSVSYFRQTNSAKGGIPMMQKRRALARNHRYSSGLQSLFPITVCQNLPCGLGFRQSEAKNGEVCQNPAAFGVHRVSWGVYMRWAWTAAVSQAALSLTANTHRQRSGHGIPFMANGGSAGYFCRRNCVGDMPVYFLKMLENWELVENPLIRTISEMLIFLWTSMLCAYSTRLRIA